MLTKMNIVQRNIYPLSLGNVLRGMSTVGLPRLPRLSTSLPSSSRYSHSYGTERKLMHVERPFQHQRFYSKPATEEVSKQNETSVQDDSKLPDQESENAVSATEEEEEAEEGYGEKDDGLFLTDDQIQQLSNGDEEIIKIIKYIQLEHAVMRQEGQQVPSAVSMKHWKELITLNSRSRRKKYYLYLFKTEMSRINQVRKKLEKREARLKGYAENPIPPREEDIYGTFYALSRNCLHLRLYDTTVNRHFNLRACSAMIHNPPLVLDCSYDEHMTLREAKNCAKQIEFIIAENRMHPEPYNLYLCNAREDSNVMRYLYRMCPTLKTDEYIVNVHEESYLDFFPKKRLVYLTPHTRDDLEEYNEDDIYIIGAMVDKSDPRPYSMAKAKKLDITMKRLPLDKYLMWGLGGKSLTLNQMLNIMLEVRYSRGDWKAAMKHVPMRKLNRNFHPYPNQEQDEGENTDHNPDSSSESWKSERRERKSLVLEDYELMNRRKGYKRSSMYTPRPPPQQFADYPVRAPRMKSLLKDDE